jgi:hypothetical protein
MRQRFVILLPSHDRSAVLTVGVGKRARLPSVESRAGRLADALAALARTNGITAPFLRVAGREELDGRTSFLCELDAASASWEPRAPLRWLALDSADPVRLAQGLSGAVARWLDEQRGAPVPAQRAPWARPGWLDELREWVSGHVAVRSGPHLVRQWPLSSVQRFETDEGSLYLKAAFSLFHHEPVMTEALSREHPGLVPEVVAVQRRRGWLLMRELQGPHVDGRPVDAWHEMVRVLAGIQQAWLGRAEELVAFGAPDRSLERLRAQLPQVIDDLAPRARPSLPRLERLCDRLAETELVNTLVHGDFHPGNGVAGPSGIVIFDWSDACVAPALFDLPTFLDWTRFGSRRRAFVRTYAACWPRREMERLWPLVAPLAHLHHAVSYRDIGTALEPADRGLFPYEPRRWVRTALKLLD